MQVKTRHNFIKFALVFLVLVVLSALVLIACGGSFEKTDKQELPTPTAEDAATDGVLSLADYTIVRADNSGNPVLKQALNLRAAIRDAKGETPVITTDFTPDGGGAEILLGNTNRAQSQAVIAQLTENTRFIIRSLEGKIVIVAHTQNELAQAVSYFCENYLDQGDLSAISYTEARHDTVILCAHSSCQFVIPDSASADFEKCASDMLATLGEDRLSVLRYKDYRGGKAVILGKIPEDEISVAYGEPLKDGEYIARSAANNVYLQGYDELLTLTALGDFLHDLQINTNRDFDGNRYLAVQASYSFNRNWEFDVPKAVQAKLDFSENVAGSMHIFYYAEVSEYAYSLYKQMLRFLGFSTVPSAQDIYIRSDVQLSLTYLQEEGTMSVVMESAPAAKVKR